MAFEVGTAPVGVLLKSLARDTGELVRQEMQLAGAEMAAKARVSARSAAVIAVGGSLVHLGLLAILASCAVALAAIVPLWVSALGVGILVLLAGLALIRAGIQAIERSSPVPEQALSEVRGDLAFNKELSR
jgi:hypothetical protein